jgi:hypothetical protein
MKHTLLTGTLALAFGCSAPAFAQDAAAVASAPAAASDATAAAPATTTAPAVPVAPVEPSAAAAAAPTADATAAAAATPPAAVAFASTVPEAIAATIGKPEAGKGLVVFYRPSKFVGGAIGFKVREDGQELGKLRNGNWFAVQVAPGAHAYDVHGEKHDVTNIEVEAGETYFLSGAMGMGVFAGRPNLSPSNADAFALVLPKLKPSKPLD